MCYFRFTLESSLFNEDKRGTFCRDLDPEALVLLSWTGWVTSELAHFTAGTHFISFCTKSVDPLACNFLFFGPCLSFSTLLQEERKPATAQAVPKTLVHRHRWPLGLAPSDGQQREFDTFF